MGTTAASSLPPRSPPINAATTARNQRAWQRQVELSPDQAVLLAKQPAGLCSGRIGTQQTTQKFSAPRTQFQHTIRQLLSQEALHRWR